ncbi:BrnT family toxin [Rhizobium calliandrae]|uniref:BrnT family toxin n=1 Tax=Rhizobium calliandrae TaxID=1312182 RepID=A0ABT7KFI6_9HYPH|nr:BrnT family toxin [Rhizobium calliandrae]MDL2407367.1 BrnT family toxin [Rhizobium calliandrae]
MKIIWDETKRETNLTKHRLDFADLSLEFFRDAKIGPAKADRFVAVGELDGQMVIAVVFKPLGSEAISVISMRPASSKERRA